MAVKGIKDLERLVNEQETIKDSQFNAVLYIIKNNKHLLEKIPIKGRINDFRALLQDKDEKIEGAVYYPRKGFKIGSTKGFTRGSWHPNIPHSGSDSSSYHRIYYIPSNNKFISVAIHSISGHTAGFAGYSYFNLDFNGAKETTKAYVFDNFSAKSLLNHFSKKEELYLENIKIYKKMPKEISK